MSTAKYYLITLITIVYLLLIGFLTWKVHWAMILVPLLWHPDFEEEKKK